MVYKKVLLEVDKMVVHNLVKAAIEVGEAGSYDADKAAELEEDFCDYLVGVKRVDKVAKGIDASVLLAMNAEINEIIVCITGMQMLIKLALRKAGMLEENADEAG